MKFVHCYTQLGCEEILVPYNMIERACLGNNIGVIYVNVNGGVVDYMASNQEIKEWFKWKTKVKL